VKLEDKSLTISSESQAFEVIESYLSGLELPEGVSFEGWPSLKFRLTGEKFHGSLTPTVMKGFVDMQAQINKAFAKLKYGIPDPRKLSDEDKESIEIQVNVEEGSSLVEVNMDGFLGQVIQSVVHKVTPQDLVFISVSVALIWGGTTIMKTFLNNRKDIRKDEVKGESERAHLDAMKFMSEQETKRAELLTRAISQNEQLKSMDKYSHNAKADLLKSLSAADTTEFSDVVLDRDDLKELTTNARRRFRDIRIDGVYKIEKVDSTNPDSFRVQIREVKTEKRISCVVQDVFLEASENKKCLQQAEWNRSSVHLTINAKELDGEISSAVILYVNPVEIND